MGRGGANVEDVSRKVAYLFTADALRQVLIKTKWQMPHAASQGPALSIQKFPSTSIFTAVSSSKIAVRVFGSPLIGSDRSPACR